MLMREEKKTVHYLLSTERLTRFWLLEKVPYLDGPSYVSLAPLCQNNLAVAECFWWITSLSFLKILPTMTVCAKHWSPLCEARPQRAQCPLQASFHRRLPRAHPCHQFRHRTSFEISALMAQDLATMSGLIAVLKLIAL